MKIKTGDNVRVLSGKERGKSGKVIQVVHRKDNGKVLVVVEGLNIRKKHIRARKQGEKGQVIEWSAPLHISKVMLLDPKSNTPTRVGFTMEGNKKKRTAKKSGAVIE